MLVVDITAADTTGFGAEVKPGETHVEWLRVGGHDVLSRPE